MIKYRFHKYIGVYILQRDNELMKNKSYYRFSDFWSWDNATQASFMFSDFSYQRVDSHLTVN